MLFAGWEVRIVKNCDRGLAEQENLKHWPTILISLSLGEYGLSLRFSRNDLTLDY